LSDRLLEALQNPEFHARMEDLAEKFLAPRADSAPGVSAGLYDPSALYADADGAIGLPAGMDGEIDGVGEGVPAE
jgi:hypothetical protein